MKFYFKPVWGLLILLFSMESSFASKRDSILCSCNRDDYSPAGVMVGMRHLKGMWMFSYNYMNMQMQHNLSGTSSVDDETILNNYLMSPISMRMDMHMLMGMYGLSDRVTLMAMLNYNSLDMKMNMLSSSHSQTSSGGHNHSGNSSSEGLSLMEMESKTSGMADTKLYALWSFYVRRGTVLMASGGISIPTGSINQKGTPDDMMYPNRRFPYMMQMGSGTVDFAPGVTLLQHAGNFKGSVQATGTVRAYDNANGYRPGNELALNAWGAYQFLSSLAPSLRIDATFTESIQNEDKQLYRVMEPGAAAENYGGTKVNGYIGLSYYFHKIPVIKNSRILAEYGLPVYQHLNGIQQPQKYVLNAAWRFAF